MAKRNSIAEAVALHRAGDLAHARRIYQRILAAAPTNVEALHFLGVLHHQEGQSDQALASIARAIRLAPDYADAHNNLGNVLKETGQLEGALRAYQRVVELVPGHADAWNNIGVLLRGLGQYGEADRAYAHAIDSKPDHAAAWRNRGNLFARMDRLDDAAAAYARVLELRPRDTAVYDALSRTLYRAHKVDEAIHVYEQWLHADPGNSVARHMLAACTGVAAPPRASEEYVRDTFDAFASSFDQVLDQLGYRAPALIAEWLTCVLPAPDASLDIADAGCGTGLCADFLRPRARQLVGVDLSPGMLARSRARQKYDVLIEGELTAWLTSQRQAFDLIVSADTLCYFGDLDQVLTAAAEALRPAGRLVFTLENASAQVSAFQLNPSGRYGHTQSYVREALARTGLTMSGVDPVVLRREVGQEVNGWLVTAERPRA